MDKAERNEAVAIAPLGVKYFYQTAPWQYLDNLLSQLKDESGLRDTANRSMGLNNGVNPSESQQAELYQRLIALAAHLLSLMEGFYRKFYQQELAVEGSLRDRLQALLDAALKVA